MKKIILKMEKKDSEEILVKLKLTFGGNFYYFFMKIDLKMT